MKRRRTFIAIHVPQKIRAKLASFGTSYPELPARWTKEENLHITLLFLGYMQDQEVAELCGLCQQEGERHAAFDITLSRIIYAPKGKAPRFVWAVGEKSTELSSLYAGFRSALSSFPFQSQEQEFTPHITLARIRQWELQRTDPEEWPSIEEDIKFAFSVPTIEVMESHLRKGGPVYDTIETIELSS